MQLGYLDMKFWSFLFILYGFIAAVTLLLDQPSQMQYKMVVQNTDVQHSVCSG